MKDKFKLTLIAGHIWQGPIPKRKLQRLKSFSMTGLKNFWAEDVEEYASNQFIHYEDDSTLSTKLQQYPLVGKIFSSVGYRLAPTTVHKKETLYRHYTVNRTRDEPPYGELTSLPVQEAERVTAQALKEPNR